MSKKFAERTKLNLSEVNKEVLGQWDAEDVFHKSMTEREGCPSFIFFEGPPSANGHPGIHHVLARSLKDTFCRFKTMKGFQVKRKAGWDTHGLPVELGVEKELGITKEDIGTKISIEDYNRRCRENVMMFTSEWEDLSHKMGYWVDMENPYITYDNKYIETLWWLLKQLYNKDLLYKGYTIQPYSPAAGTGLSSHELNQPGCYRDVKDTTVTAQFRVLSVDGCTAAEALPKENLYILAWTTTPWTLPSNTALCVGPKIDYVAVKGQNPYTNQEAVYVVAENLLSAHFKAEEGTELEILWKGKGADLVGIKYQQLMPWVKPCAIENGKPVVKEDEAFRLKFISGGHTSTAELSITQAKSEIQHFAQILHNGLGYVRSAVHATKDDEFEHFRQKLVKYEEISDRIEFEIASFLKDIPQESISEHTRESVNSMYKIINEMESLGDSGEAISRILTRRNKHAKTFSAENIRSIDALLDLVDKAYIVMIENLKSDSVGMLGLKKAVDCEIQINELRNLLREEEINNMEKDGTHYLSSVYYMDVISEIERMGDFIINISQALEKK